MPSTKEGDKQSLSIAHILERCGSELKAQAAFQSLCHSITQSAPSCMGTGRGSGDRATERKDRNTKKWVGERLKKIKARIGGMESTGGPSGSIQPPLESLPKATVIFQKASPLLPC